MRVPSTSEFPVCIQILCAYTGTRDAETQTPRMLRKPRDLPQVCPRPKTFYRLATRDTLHGSRPNLRQSDPDGRIMPTPPDVSDKGATTIRCARRKKITHAIIHIHIYIDYFVIIFFPRWYVDSTNEKQAYKRTVHILDHKSHIAIYFFFLQIFIDFS